MRITVLLAGMGLVYGLCAPALSSEPNAAPLTLEEAARLALDNQPNLDAYRKAAEAAREAAIAEAQLPDPQLRLGVQNVPVQGEDAFRLNRDDMTMATVGVMQEIVRKPIRTAAAGRLQAESEQWQAERAAEAQRVVRDARLAWIDAFDSAKRAELLQRMAQELAAERDVVIKRIPAGGGETRELFQLEMMLAMTNDKRLVAENAARKAKAQLSRWLGAAAFRPLPAELPAPMFPSSRLPPDDLDAHPELAAMRKIEKAAHFDVERARAERRPNWSWELMYGKRQEGRADMVTLQFALPLPWNRAELQDRRLAEKLAAADRARSLTLDRARELKAELAAALADRDAAVARNREHVERLIPAAQARLATARA
ncbi:MAG TPA: TolC family protein, partial [Xanthobacteraceae bacterium]|nr:TolC family protein [Xanthobacteraceae bacterium]